MATRERNRMLIGYARVSKLDEQDNHAQVQELKKAGCKRIYQENAPAARWNRPALHEELEQLPDDDVLVVWKPDRLSRSLTALPIATFCTFWLLRAVPALDPLLSGGPLEAVAERMRRLRPRSMLLNSRG